LLIKSRTINKPRDKSIVEWASNEIKLPALAKNNICAKIKDTSENPSDICLFVTSAKRGFITRAVI
jgi:hypothetical protein